MIENKQKFENLKPEDFEFVQKDERIFDKKFDTKPIGYFKDAMIRFSKNKTNVVATIILATLILLSILVPIFTTKNYTRLMSDLGGLPPRVPLIEKLGVLDGTRDYKGQTVDLTTIDEKTGKGLPKGFNAKFIDMSTLKNNFVSCDVRIQDCQEGTSVLYTSLGKLKSAVVVSKLVEGDPNDIRSMVIKPTQFRIYQAEVPIIVLDVASFQGTNPALKVLVTTDTGETYTTVKTITEPGVYEIDIYKESGIKSHGFTSDIRLELSDETANSSVVLNKFELYKGSTDNEPLVSDSGFSLSLYRLVNDKDYSGSYVRNNGKLMQASFTYDVYGAALDEKLINAMPKSEYNQILADNPICVPTDDPDSDDPAAALFPEGCPIKQTITEIGNAVGPDGERHSSFTVIVDNGIYLGFGKDEVPYFLFGTDAGGRDFFALIWMGLRTSLIIGLIVATINITIGVIYGAIEGYYGGKVDLLMERFSEIAGRVPWLVWLGVFVVIFGTGVGTLILILTVTGWLGVASTTRTQFYRYKGREYVLASRTLGAKDMRIIFRHILPNGIGTIITASVLMIPQVIFSESTISYLGYGLGRGDSFNLFGFIPLTGTSLGVLLAEGRIELVTKPYLVFFPSVVIAILMITFNMFGNALRDAFNPTLRGSE